MFANSAVVVLATVGSIAIFAIVIITIVFVKSVRRFIFRCKETLSWILRLGGIGDKIQDIRHGQYTIEIIYRRNDQILLHENRSVCTREAKKFRECTKKIFKDGL